MTSLRPYKVLGLALVSLWALSPKTALAEVASSQNNLIHTTESSIEPSSGQEAPEAQASQESLTDDNRVGQTLDMSQRMPLAHFVEYVYAGDGYYYPSQTFIMEFMPDANGIFQSVSIDPSQVTCYVFQLRQGGLYLLAQFDNYTTVQDLRYSPEAQDGSEILIIPGQLTYGDSYYAGWTGTVPLTIIDQIAEIQIGGQSYFDVVKLQANYPDHVEHLYLAPDLGLVAAEAGPDPDSMETVYQLIQVSGYQN